MRLPLALLLALTASPAMSHEFELLLLAPPEVNEKTRDQMRTAFLIAAHERDSHPDETSEGHLGGMDVQLTLAPAGAAVGAEDVAFVVAPFADAGDPAVAALAASTDAVVIGRGHLAAMPPDLDRIDPNLAPFADRFRAETGYAPGPEATATYRAALLVDRAVRPLDSVDDRDALRAALPAP